MSLRLRMKMAKLPKPTVTIDWKRSLYKDDHGEFAQIRATTAQIRSKTPPEASSRKKVEKAPVIFRVEFLLLIEMGIGKSLMRTRYDS